MNRVSAALDKLIDLKRRLPTDAKCDDCIHFNECVMRGCAKPGQTVCMLTTNVFQRKEKDYAD